MTSIPTDSEALAASLEKIEYEEGLKTTERASRKRPLKLWLALIIFGLSVLMSTVGWLLLTVVDGPCGGAHPCALHFKPGDGTGYAGTILLLAGVSSFVACFIGVLAILGYYIFRKHET